MVPLQKPLESTWPLRRRAITESVRYDHHLFHGIQPIRRHHGQAGHHPQLYSKTARGYLRRLCIHLTVLRDPVQLSKLSEGWAATANLNSATSASHS